MQQELLQRHAHLETSSHVFFSRWMELLCRAERMAYSDEKFLRIRHSWGGKSRRCKVGLGLPACLASVLLGVPSPPNETDAQGVPRGHTCNPGVTGAF